MVPDIIVSVSDYRTRPCEEATLQGHFQRGGVVEAVATISGDVVTNPVESNPSLSSYDDFVEDSTVAASTGIALISSFS